MSKIVVQISFYENKYRSFPTKVRIGSVDNVTISLNSTISAHPIVSGDMIADHMFKDPISITISGKISTHGDSYSVVLGANSLNRSIAQMQEMFEKVKNEGIFCKVSKIDLDIGDQTPKFIKRENMVLSSIEWPEDIDDLKFSFTFTEVLTAKIAVEQVDTTDSLLPAVSDLTQTNFTDELLNTDQLSNYVLSAFNDAGLMTENFINQLGEFSRNELTSWAIGAGIFAISKTAGLVFLLGTTIYNAITAITKAFKSSEYRIKTFDDWEKDKDRFFECVSEINKNVRVLNDAISVYRFNSDGEQIAYGSINGEYYKFKFEEIISQYRPGIGSDLVDYTSYSLKVYDISDNLIAQNPNILNTCTLFENLNSADALFRTTSGRYVFLYHFNEGKYPATDKNVHIDEHAIISSTIKPEEYLQTLEDIILNTFRG